MRRTSAEEFRS
jgi:hypothetical protein